MHGLINRAIQSFLGDTYAAPLWHAVADEHHQADHGPPRKETEGGGGIAGAAIEEEFFHQVEGAVLAEMVMRLRRSWPSGE